MLCIGRSEAQGQPSLVLALQRESRVELQGLADRRARLVELPELRVSRRLVQPVCGRPFPTCDAVDDGQCILIPMSKEIGPCQEARMLLGMMGVQSP